MTTVGRWSPNKVRARVLDGTWVSTEELGGMVLLTPTSIAYTGTSATIGANGSVEFTAVTALRLNGVFTGDYDNYLVNIRFTTSAATAVQVRLSSGGADNSTASSYVRQYLDANNTSVSGNRQSYSEWAGLAYSANTRRVGSTISFYGPYLVQPTAVRSVIVDDSSGAAITDVAGTHNQSVSYDGFNIFPAANNMTGLISVFGLVGA